MKKLTNYLSKLSTGEEPVHFKDGKDSSIAYKGKNYITHSDLHHSELALKTFSKLHLVFFLIILTLASLVAYFFGLQMFLLITISSISILYFSDLLFNLLLVYKSFKHSPEIVTSKNDLGKYSNYSWPKYTIFCPLYKEANVLAQFVNSIKNLDYPKNKLEVFLLLEEDDKLTINLAQKMNLPSYFKIKVIPDSLPKTKPKAVNYGLSLATGRYAVIYDAEDIPEPDQLKKAVISFDKVDANKVVCLQAKLNFYNARQNILTRLFTAEYSLWFDLILPGLQSIGAPIPLGGTSNHFRVAHLKDLQGWDPFNVTEDCDLGVRLWKKGFHTAVIDSTTWEESNSNIKNWLRQRSRWIKGYMQTTLVHHKKPHLLYSKHLDIHILTLNLVILGKVISVFINPLMWFITILYFAARTQFGESIEQLFPASIFYIAVISLVFGNFLYLYYMVLGLAKRGYWDLIMFFPLIPFYWLMISVSAWIALYQLIFKPHYWEKTVHGLHLNKKFNFNYTPALSEIK